LNYPLHSSLPLPTSLVSFLHLHACVYIISTYSPSYPFPRHLTPSTSANPQPRSALLFSDFVEDRYNR
jgi:hypothetical protein